MCIILSRALIHLPSCSTIAWLHVYDCICMIVCVWLCDNARMMLSWRSQDNIQLVTTCNPQWLHMCEFMLVLAADSSTMLSTAGPNYEHKNVQREHLRIMCLYYFSWERFTYLCVTSLHGCMCMLVCACLYVHACMCMIVCVWLYDNVRLMSRWRSKDNIQLVTACHPTWLRLYQFMLVACRKSISNSIACRNEHINT